MIKPLLIGLWVSAVTAASCYGTVLWQIARLSEPKEEQRSGSVAQIKTGQISVPLISGGGLQGYVVAQFVFNVDRDRAKELGVNPEPFLVDESFKTIYGAQLVEGNNLRKADLPAIAQAIKENANKRLGIAIVERVLIQAFDFIAKAPVEKQLPPSVQ